MPATVPNTIVVVEDDPNIADLVGLYLQADGFRVLLATDAARGLELAGWTLGASPLTSPGGGGRCRG